MTGLLERLPARSPRSGPAEAELISGVRARSATAADFAPVGAFLRALSLDSAYRRFFTGLGRVPDSLVRRLLAPRDGRTVVLALHGEEVVGVADTTICGTAVELGIVIADRWQRRGLGWPLADAALAPALDRVSTLRAHTLADNARVTRMLQRRWPAARPRFDDGTLVWDIDLAVPADRRNDRET